MNNIVSVMKDDLSNQTLVTYDDISKENIFLNPPNQAVDKEIISVIKDDLRNLVIVTYDDGSRENLFLD